MQQACANANVCACASINRCQRCPWQAIVAAAAMRGQGRHWPGRRFLLHCRLFWLRPGLLPFLFILWRVHVKMALGDVIASMPLVKQGLFVVCRGGALASLAHSLCVRSKQFRSQQCSAQSSLVHLAHMRARGGNSRALMHMCVCQSIAACGAPARNRGSRWRSGVGAGARLAGATFFVQSDGVGP